jgi:hypothetical protein
MKARTAKHSRPGLEPAPGQSGKARARPARGPATVSDPLAVEVEDPDSGEGGGETLAALDRSGWPPHPSERRDFYHRIRAFPPAVSAWRKRMVRHIADNPVRFPLARSASAEKIQGWLDDGVSYLREVARILAVLYGTPDLGNKPDPTDELVYIILARHTREDAYQQAFRLLSKRFRTWDALLNGARTPGNASWDNGSFLAFNVPKKSGPPFRHSD